MKQFKIFIQKEIYHIIRDKRSLIILLGMPIVLVVLFGFAITNEIVDAKIAIVDQSKDAMTREITQRLLSSSYFILEENLNSYTEIEDHFQKGKTKLVLVFSPDFQAGFYGVQKPQIQLLADATEPNTATSLINYATAIINTYQREKMQNAAVPLKIDVEVKMMYNSRLKGVFMFVPGVMTIILMLVSAMMTSIAITREKELGTMEVLLVSPLSPPLIILGKVIPYIGLALINTIVILLLGTFIFGMPVKGSLALLLAECLLFVITSLSLGILISTKTETQQIAMMISLMALMLPTILLSGFIFPIESMPNWLQVVSNIIPARWFIVIVKNIMLKGTGLAFVWKETLILCGMSLFFIAMSMKNFKSRLA